jgi:hypothetical protein
MSRHGKARPNRSFLGQMLGIRYESCAPKRGGGCTSGSGRTKSEANRDAQRNARRKR